MAVARKAGRRFEPNIWPGFVDVMTALVMVIMFVLTILVVIQWVLRERLDTQQGQLVALGSEVQTLDKALDTADIFVVYEGHSRYGQGPAFAPAGTPAFQRSIHTYT